MIPIFLALAHSLLSAQLKEGAWSLLVKSSSSTRQKYFICGLRYSKHNKSDFYQCNCTFLNNLTSCRTCQTSPVSILSDLSFTACAYDNWKDQLSLPAFGGPEYSTIKSCPQGSLMIGFETILNEKGIGDISFSCQNVFNGNKFAVGFQIKQTEKQRVTGLRFQTSQLPLLKSIDLLLNLKKSEITFTDKILEEITFLNPSNKPLNQAYQFNKNQVSLFKLKNRQDFLHEELEFGPKFSLGLMYYDYTSVLGSVTDLLKNNSRLFGVALQRKSTSNQVTIQLPACRQVTLTRKVKAASFSSQYFGKASFATNTQYDETLSFIGLFEGTVIDTSSEKLDKQEIPIC